MKRSGLSFVGAALLVGAVWAWQTYTQTAPSAGTSAPSPAPSSATVETSVGAERIRAAFADEESGVLVEVGGDVGRVLADDDDGSRHQRFILELAGGHTVLVAHNIDLAPRVPLSEGDRVRLAGQYEWNERGGVVHWTHHDPDGRHPGGWIEHEGRRYE